MQVLNFPRDNFDQDNTFSFAFQGRRGEQTRTGYLFNSKDEGRIYILQGGICIKQVYTQADRDETTRLAAQQPVRSGDTVEVNGKQYQVRINGDFSDAGYLIEIQA